MVRKSTILSSDCGLQPNAFSGRPGTFLTQASSARTTIGSVGAVAFPARRTKPRSIRGSVQKIRNQMAHQKRPASCSNSLAGIPSSFYYNGEG